MKLQKCAQMFAALHCSRESVMVDKLVVQSLVNKSCGLEVQLPEEAKQDQLWSHLGRVTGLLLKEL